MLDRFPGLRNELSYLLDKNTTWTTLATLNLAFNLIDIEGAVALSESTILANLTTLNLDKKSSVMREQLQSARNTEQPCYSRCELLQHLRRGNKCSKTN